MMGIQQKAYIVQSTALMLCFFTLISLILDSETVAAFLLVGTIGCIVKAMMYRERWEIDTKYDMYQNYLREIENE